MADDDEYELLPRQEINNLKREIERLRKNPLGEIKEAKDLLDGVNALNINIKKLIDLFTKAEADLAKEYAENNPADQLKAVKEQNEDIARGILALADLIKQMKDKPVFQQQQQPLPPPPQYNPQFSQESKSYPQQGFDMNAQQNPPMPEFPNPNSPPFDFGGTPFPEPEKKKGLFSRK